MMDMNDWNLQQVSNQIRVRKGKPTTGSIEKGWISRVTTAYKGGYD
jgi:hypothetical protein